MVVCSVVHILYSVSTYFWQCSKGTSSWFSNIKGKMNVVMPIYVFESVVVLENVRFVLVWNKRFCRTIACYSPTALFYLFVYFYLTVPYNNAEIYSSQACPCLIRFIIFTRLQLCHYTENMVTPSRSPLPWYNLFCQIGYRKCSRCNGIIVGMGHNLCS